MSTFILRRTSSTSASGMYIGRSLMISLVVDTWPPSPSTACGGSCHRTSWRVLWQSGQPWATWSWPHQSGRRPSRVHWPTGLRKLSFFQHSFHKLWKAHTQWYLSTGRSLALINKGMGAGWGSPVAMMADTPKPNEAVKQLQLYPAVNPVGYSTNHSDVSRSQEAWDSVLLMSLRVLLGIKSSKSEESYKSVSTRHLAEPEVSGATHLIELTDHTSTSSTK